MWEHLVLDILRTHLNESQLFYWRDKSRREIDFIIKRPGNSVDIVECKINPDKLSPEYIKTFRESYPKGNNFCFSPYVTEAYTWENMGIKINFIGSVKDLQ